jgi:Protein of unknown function (DUF3088)
LQPILYLLSPTAIPGGVFCPESALLEGVLAYYTRVADVLEVKRIGFVRPRPDLVEELGEGLQDAPVLVFSGLDAPPEAQAAPTGRRYLLGPQAIVQYLAGVGVAGRLAS